MSTWWAKGFEHSRDVARAGVVTVHVAYEVLNPVAVPLVQQYVSRDPMTGTEFSRQIDENRQKDWAEYQKQRYEREYADLGKRPPQPAQQHATRAAAAPGRAPGQPDRTVRTEPKPESGRGAEPTPSRDRSRSGDR